jgi:hypothetical protein
MVSTLSTCPIRHDSAAPRLLAGKLGQVDTLFTYHRTWETGVGNGHEGRRIQPFIIFQHLSPKLTRALQSSVLLKFSLRKL